MKRFIIKRLGPRYSELVRGASSALIAKVLGAGLGFAFNVVVARSLGPEGTGLYFLALACVAVLSLLGRLGLDNTLLREVAARADAEHWSEVVGTYRTGIKLALGGSLLCFVLLFLSAPYVARGIFDEPSLVGPLRAMSFAVVPLSLLMLNGECLKALKRVFESQLVQSTLIQAISVTVFLIVGRRFGVYGAVLSYLAAVSVTSLISWGLWRRQHFVSGLRATHVSSTALLIMSAPLLYAGLLNLMSGWTASFVLGAFSTATDVGIYNVAFRAAWLISLVLVAVNAVAAPKFAAFYRDGKEEELKQAVTGAARLAFVVALPIFLVMFAAPALVMGIFGSGFATSGSTVLKILAVSQIVNVGAGPVMYLLMMSGHQKVVLRCVLTSTVVLVVSTVLLVPFFGASGAAVGSLTGVAVQNFLAAFYAWDRVAVWSLPFGGRMVTRLTDSEVAKGGILR